MKKAAVLLMYCLMIFCMTTLCGMDVKEPKKDQPKSEPNPKSKPKPEAKSAMGKTVDKIFVGCKNYMNSGGDKYLQEIPGSDFKEIVKEAGTTKKFAAELVQLQRVFEVMAITEQLPNSDECYKRLKCVASKMYDICAALQIAHFDALQKDDKLYVRFMLIKIFFGAIMSENRDALEQSVRRLKGCELGTKQSFQDLIDDLDGHPRLTKKTQDAPSYVLLEQLKSYFYFLAVIDGRLHTHKF